MDKIEEIALKLKLDKFTEMSQIKFLAEQTKQKAIVVVFALFVIKVLFLVFTSTGRMLIEAACLFLYPAYKSFTALNTDSTVDDKKWLTYWVAFGFLYGVESTFEIVFSIIPFWGLLKILLLLALLHPKFGGAETLYSKVIRPFLSKYDDIIDQYISTAESKLKDLGTKAKGRATEAVVNNFVKKNE
jgi:receptor expression-enhancing protein 5/6